jgi:hypothetical protein
MSKKSQDTFSQLKEYINDYDSIFRQVIQYGTSQKNFNLGNQWDSKQRKILQDDIGMRPLISNDIKKHRDVLVAEVAKNMPMPIIQTINSKATKEFERTVEVFNQFLIEHLQSNNLKVNLLKAFEEILDTGCPSAVCVIPTEKDGYTFDKDVLSFHISYDGLLYDTQAKLPTKSDGKYIGYAMRITKNEFEANFPNKEFVAQTTMSGFLQDTEISNVNINTSNYTIIFCIFVREKSKKEIYLTSFNRIIDDKKDLEEGEKIIQTRITNISTIKQYYISDSEILSEEIYPFEQFPIIVLDGLLEITTQLNNGDDDYNGMLRPRSFGYAVQDLQKAKNMAFSQIGSSMLKRRRFTVMANKDGLTKDALSTLKEPLKEDMVLLYRGEGKVNEPSIVPQGELPQTVMGFFGMAQQSIDSTLGRYADVQGNTQDGSSGIARYMSITQNNLSTFYFIKNLEQTIQQISYNLSEILPKIIASERTIVIGDKKFFLNSNPNQSEINSKNILDFSDIDWRKLNIKVGIGSTFEIQREKYLNNLLTVINGLTGNSNDPKDQTIKYLLIQYALDLFELPNSSKIKNSIIRVLEIYDPIAASLITGDKTIDEIKTDLEKQQQEASQFNSINQQLDLQQKKNVNDSIESQTKVSEETARLKKIQGMVDIYNQDINSKRQKVDEIKELGELSLENEKLNQKNREMDLDTARIAQEDQRLDLKKYELYHQQLNELHNKLSEQDRNLLNILLSRNSK